ncbi:AzlD domain-containing protein [Pseudooceanicola algae]|uniref:Uncharacterized protein n=1 Tax=Pseudooceanicola algae TaxID=1537215 RepID=A0A418SKN0_9RHOB|nr:AzlD domain-containing protein [Pseudooceanicola algae]QPM90707.1 hypothetical protein PSAL_019460 [Pseudooceanicola algae]
MIDRSDLWIVIIGLGIGSYLLRFVFLGIIGSRPMPVWLMRHLRYTAVAVLPALVTPMVVWPAGTDGSFDMARLLAALTTFGIGLWFRNTLAAIIGGAATLYLMLWVLG